MIPAQFIPWLALGAVFAIAASWVGGDYHGHSAEKTTWVAVQAQERAAAATIQARAEKRAHDAETASAEAARIIEETHAKDLADADATRADFTERLRAAAGSRRCDRLPQPAANPGSGTITAVGSEPEHRQPDIDAGERLRDAALKLQAYARACHTFAMESGR